MTGDRQNWRQLAGITRVDERRCLVIAEVAQAHDGSLGLAHAFVAVSYTHLTLPTILRV